MVLHLYPDLPPVAFPILFTMTQPPTPSTYSQNGIDIRDALSILSLRAKSGGDSDHISPSSVSDKLKRMGQTIDIVDEETEFTELNNAAALQRGCGCAGNTTNGDINSSASSTPVVNDEEEAKKHDAMKQERARREEEIRTELRSMRAMDLLGMIFRAQQERVATYKLFEEGLSTILASGNITTYPSVCAKATASFSVLSDTINAVKASLETNNHNRKDITIAIAQLQKDESEKLNLTAALHLERLRLQNSKLEGMISSSSEGCTGEDDRTASLLKAGIRSLECNISDVVERINEALEELRCIAADESD